MVISFEEAYKVHQRGSDQSSTIALLQTDAPPLEGAGR